MLNDESGSKQLAALAHPARLAIVRALTRAGPGGLAAGRLGQQVGVSPNALTFHLQKLAHNGLVSSRREGRFIIYVAAFDDLLELARHLVGACCNDSVEKCGSACAGEPQNGVAPVTGCEGTWRAGVSGKS